MGGVTASTCEPPGPCRVKKGVPHFPSAPDHDNEQFSDVGDDSNDDDLPPVYRKKKRTPQPFIAPLRIPPPVEDDEPYQAAYKSHAD